MWLTLLTIKSGAKVVWNNVTNKATCERNFVKDALLLAISEELKQNCLTGEKANSSDDDMKKKRKKSQEMWWVIHLARAWSTLSHHSEDTHQGTGPLGTL